MRKVALSALLLLQQGLLHWVLDLMAQQALVMLAIGQMEATLVDQLLMDIVAVRVEIGRSKV
jgi:hypothetical protein